MKRFLLFSYPSYYPGGGKNDVVDSYDTLEEAIEATKKYPGDGYDVLDLETREWVA